MIDKRYHVFISTSGADTKVERTVLSQALVGLGFFSWGLENRTPQTTTFARRQIDDCDYFILLLGGCYGEQLTSGVSHFHLEYIYAITKNKPVMVIMHESPDQLPAELQESTPNGVLKFNEFRKQLQRERDSVVTYRETRDIEMALRYAMPQFAGRYPAIGWIRPTQVSTLQQENDRLNQVIQRMKATPRSRPDNPILQIPVMQGEEKFTFDYKVHVYQDSNFSELQPQRSMSWSDLLVIIGPGFSPAAPEENFARLMNTYLNDHALIDVSAIMPRAHAAARSQINIRALHAIKMQFKNNDWIVPIGRDQRDRIVWELTVKGEKHLAQIHYTAMQSQPSVEG